MANKTAVQLAEKQHEVMLGILNDSIKHFDSNGFDYLVIVGKGGLSSRYANGTIGELGEILASVLMENEALRKLIEASIHYANIAQK